MPERNTHIARLVKETAPALMAQPGIGVQSAAQLLVTAGDNPAGCTPKGPSPTCAAWLRYPSPPASAWTATGST